MACLWSVRCAVVLCSVNNGVFTCCVVYVMRLVWCGIYCELYLWYLFGVYWALYIVVYHVLNMVWYCCILWFVVCYILCIKYAMEYIVCSVLYIVVCCAV